MTTLERLEPHAGASPAGGSAVAATKTGSYVGPAWAVSIPRLVWVAFVAAVFLDGLDAYSFLGVPLPWLGQLVISGAALLTLMTGYVRFTPGLGILCLLAVWAVVSTVFAFLSGEYPALMPPIATSSYPVFLALRLFKLISFGATLYVTYWLLHKTGRERVVRLLIFAGVLIAAVAIYLHLAYLFGLPAPLRSRLGTGGSVQVVDFADYYFQRALGTFREPSFLAAWLLVPLMLSLSRGRSALRLATPVCATAFLLTGSLAGIASAVIGFVGAILIANPLQLVSFKRLVRVTAVTLLAVVAFDTLVLEDTSLFSALGARVENIFERGLVHSNRGYVYEVLPDMPLSVGGVGLGHGNLLLSQLVNPILVTSFMSFYLNTLYSLGLLGLALVLGFVLYPIVIGLLHRPRLSRRVPFWSLAAYLGWLVLLMFLAEELTFMFAVIYALFAHAIAYPGSRR